MNRRRGTGLPNALAPPPDPLAPNPPSSPSQSSRSASPSGLAHLFAKPKSWFVRSASASKVAPSSTGPTVASVEVRPANAAGARKHKISRPTDPRPILDGYVASRSVLNLSQAPQASLGHVHPSPSVPASPVVSATRGSISSPLSDLRSISRKPWSRSADDLSQVLSSTLNTVSFQEKIAEYRGRSGSSASALISPGPTSPNVDHAAQHPFPVSKPQQSEGGSTQIPIVGNSTTLPAVSISVSPPQSDPMNTDPDLNKSVINITHTDAISSGSTQIQSETLQSTTPQTKPSHVHTRSYSFTPKLPSKLSNPKLALGPKRKGSGPNEREADAQYQQPRGGQETIHESRQHGRGNGQTTASTPTRAGFTFPFTTGSGNHRDANQGGGSTAQHPNRTTLLAPPIINEPKCDLSSVPPEGETSRLSARRASQIVYHTGFINRLAEPSSSHGSPFYYHSQSHFTRGDALAKGWKAYKLELKGTKLFFYKAPSDRSAGIKELFPTGLVPPSLEDETDEIDGIGEKDPSFVLGSGGAKSKMKEGDATGINGKKKRAFWGRRAHPDLVRDIQNGKLEKGTSEALIHEAVFGATFFPREFSTPNPSDTPQQQSSKEADIFTAWRSFASSVLLSLPNIVGRQAFESEFMRCCAYLISGASEENEEKEKEKDRVKWLVKEYLGFVAEAENEGWEDWVKETLDCELASLSIEHREIADMDSPNLNTFSPRPHEAPGKFVSLMEALQMSNESTLTGNVKSTPSSTTSNPTIKDKQSLDLRTFENQLPPSPSAPQQPPPSPSQMRQSTYPGRTSRSQDEGLTREVPLTSDPHFMAQSLTLYHRSVVDRVPGVLTSEYLLPTEWNDSNESSDNEIAKELDPAFGTDEKPHWLTKFILLQIFTGDTSSSYYSQHHHHTLQSGKTENYPGRGTSTQPQTSRVQSRSEMISVWAKVGELCRMNGDECSWKAIVEALCARPVARLEKVWKRVDPLALQAIKSWVYPPGILGEQFFSTGLGGGGGLHSTTKSGMNPPVAVSEPKVTPWGGHIRAKISEELAKVKDDQMLSVNVLMNVHSLFSSFRLAIGTCLKQPQVEQGDISEDIKGMVRFWKEMASEGGGKGSLTGKLKKIEHFMALSLAAEPRKKGLFEPYFWAKATPGVTNAPPNVSLLPLIFPESLSSVTLIDRSQLIRGRADSEASDIHFLRGGTAGVDPQFRILRSVQQNANEATKRSILGTGGTVISLYNGELMLVVQPGGMESTSRPSSRAPSRPPSSIVDGWTSVGMGLERDKPINRAPSIRVKPTSSHGLDRKTSLAKRNSLPSLSRKPTFTVSERSSDPPLRVLVQAGTMNALVTVLAHGLRNVSVPVADDNGEMTLKEGMTRELVVDRMEFARVWWNVFRSFLTPLVFFELLRKMYIMVQPSGSSPSVADYLEVLASRTRVLELISDWLTIGGGAQDVLDDQQLYIALSSFLNSSADHVVFKTENFEEQDVAVAWVGLSNTKTMVQSVFDAQTKRPTTSKAQHLERRRGESTSGVAGALDATSAGRTRGASNREPSDLDGMNAEELVDNIDGMARAAQSNVTEEDLYVTADLLEVQTSDKTGWFSSREISHSDEVIDIQNMYTHIQEVEPSSLISGMIQDTLYKLLPPAIRSCIRAYAIIRKWLIAKLVTPKLGLRGRQMRMELLLRAIEVARLRNAEPNASHHIEQPCVRSFVEAVITSAIVSVESRIHQRLWQYIAYNRGCTCESVAGLLAKPLVQSTSSRDCLTVDMGWLIERMLEVIASPDVLEASTQEGQNLVNFDKRRHLCNLVNRATSLPYPRKTSQSGEATRRSFDRLSVIEREVLLLQFDYRGIREESTREALGMATPSSMKKIAKPFQKLVTFQVEKNRRDRNLRSRLQKEKLQELSRNDKREDMLNKAMRPKKQSSAVAQKQHRNKKSMSAFLSFMRPISSAFGADLSVSGGGGKKTLEELDFPTSGKPSLVLSIMDAKVAQFINNERSFTFQLDTEDGGHYILQAASKKEMNRWLEIINQVTSMAAKRRLTYLGPKPQIQDHIHEQPIVASRDPHAVFGVELEFLLQREAGGGPVSPGTVPIIIDQCLSEVESRGLSEVGIYRIAGAVSEINSLRDAYNRGEYPITNINDIHAVCDLVKAWFRVLPEPVFPPSSYHDIMNAMRTENFEDRLSAIRDVVQALPQAKFDLLKRVAEHLDKVTDYEENNQMTAEALAIVFSPNLLRAPQNDFVTILNNMGQSHRLVKALITHFHSIFDEADTELDEVHSEEDGMESPILEEDEDEEEEEVKPPDVASE